MCTAMMVVAMAVAVVYAILGVINYEYCANLPRFYFRLALTLFYSFETVLFAHRCSVYMEIGGDFALARRSSSLMILALAISAIVEAYYVSAAVVDSGTVRAAYMCAIIFVACIAALPLIQFQYMDMHFLTMRLLVVVGMAASLVLFMFGFLFIALNEIKLYSAEGVLQTMSRVLDGLSPVYFVNFIPGMIILTMAHITLKKEEKRNAKFLPSDLSKDSFLNEQQLEEIRKTKEAEKDEDLEYYDL